MKLVVLKNHLGGKILHRSLNHVKKTASSSFSVFSEGGALIRRVNDLIKINWRRAAESSVSFEATAESTK